MTYRLRSPLSPCQQPIALRLHDSRKGILRLGSVIDRCGILSRDSTLWFVAEDDNVLTPHQIEACVDGDVHIRLLVRSGGSSECTPHHFLNLRGRDRRHLHIIAMAHDTGGGVDGDVVLLWSGSDGFGRFGRR